MLTPLERLVRLRVPGGPVALTRVMLGVALAVMSLESSAALYGLGAGKLTYPYVSWAPDPPDWLSYAVLLIGLISAVTLVIGVLPHIMAAVSCLSCLVTLGADQQTYSNHLLLLALLLGFLTFAEADRRWGISTGRHRGERTAPFWPQLLMMTQVSACYLFAGLSKIQPTFLSGEPLAGWMWPSLPGGAFVALAWLTVVTEVGLAVVLWVPKLRILGAVAGIGLHLSIIVFLDQRLALVAFAFATISSYPLFLSRPSLDRVALRPAGAPLASSRS